ncbi:hypothetical protein [Aureimonas sp. AU4]|uniref:hypothetical protein n=1 Tax=Aureimonas sp. AU4 TaxID=1638163 RepID=UPI0007809F0A|nr:hypothetical protein [Aureimonas sp. AU4]
MSLVVNDSTRSRRFCGTAGAIASIAELHEMRSTVADLVAREPAYLPIFERLDAMVGAHEANDPIARARALIAAQKAMA